MNYESLIWACATFAIGPTTVLFLIDVIFDYIGKFLFGRD